MGDAKHASEVFIIETRHTFIIRCRNCGYQTEETVHGYYKLPHTITCQRCGLTSHRTKFLRNYNEDTIRSYLKTNLKDNPPPCQRKHGFLIVSKRSFNFPVYERVLASLEEKQT